MSNNDKLSPGMVLGRYELLLPIAQGGMATVWAARLKGSRGFQKTVAVKTMLPNLSDDPQFEQMFLDEASLASRIHHPSVAEILDLGEQDEILYLVMEWVDGEALSVIARTAKKSNAIFPQRISLRILRQACAGLHAAHELRDERDSPLDLVHRDVSPQNVLVTYDGIVKLVDFGVAKAIGRAGGETTAGQLKGKVPYMSPEQARGGKVDRRTDIFAMGIVLYKLTVGAHPFLGENDLATMKNIITKNALPPSAKNPSFSPELEQLILKCLQKDPDQRFQTMSELDRALERVLAITGASVVDDDVGSFVRTVMGDRGQKRRAALRDAVRLADERAAGIAQAPASPVIHEGVSELLLTRMASGVSNNEMLGERLSLLSAPAVSAPPAPLSSPGPVPGALEMDDIPEPPKTRRGLMAASALTALVAGGVIALVLFRGSAGGAPSPAPSALAAGGAADAASAPPAAGAVPEVASVATAAPGSPAAAEPPVLNVDELPNVVEEKTAPRRRSARDASATDATGSKDARGKPAASARDASRPPAQPGGKPAGSAWVPAVQNPGF